MWERRWECVSGALTPVDQVHKTIYGIWTEAYLKSENKDFSHQEREYKDTKMKRVWWVLEYKLYFEMCILFQEILSPKIIVINF